MPINRGSEDSLRDHPDAPRRTRRKSKLAVSDADLVALRKHFRKLEAERKRNEALKAAAEVNVQGELL